MQSSKIHASLSAVLARRSSRRAQRGASLLEAIAYLGIAAIVVIGAVALLNGAFNSAGANDLAQQVSAIQTGTKKLYMGAGGYTNVSNTVLEGAGVFPSTIPVASGGVASDVWGGAVTVTSASAGVFAIEYKNVPNSVCVSALTAGGSWVSISVNATVITTLPVSPSTAQSDCQAGDNDIIWTST